MTLIITLISNYLIYLLASAVLVGGWFWREIDTRRRYLWWIAKFVVTLVIVYAVTVVLGYLHPEARPFVEQNTTPLVAHVADNSFPSTHAALGAVMAVFIWKINVRWGFVALLLVGVISVVRVLARLHYPADIVVGLVVGVVISVVALRWWPHKLGG